MQNIDCKLRTYGFEPRKLVIRHADTLICFQWYVLVLTLRLAVYMLPGKYKIKFGQK